MSWLRKRAEEICSEDTPKADIERLAREFAERAVRAAESHMRWTEYNMADIVTRALVAADKET